MKILHLFKKLKTWIAGPQRCAWKVCRAVLLERVHVFYGAKFCNRYCAKEWFADLQTEARKTRDMVNL